MAESTCIKCNSGQFERKFDTTAGVWLIQCSSCGGVVGVIPPDYDRELKQLAQDIRNLRR